MAWLHTWCGLVSGWLLCAIFTTVGPSVLGAATTRWVQAQPPEQAAATAAEASRMGCDTCIAAFILRGMEAQHAEPPGSHIYRKCVMADLHLCVKM
ncbi:PepSY domain-containing protein [Comamonas koreensis]|uniref:PepSY domain-containing protein n=1 Tax=Comamonas koreensis TaxID=160825 RepID=A0AAW4XY91_9BURK|nr:PepSY domain-containing protein [Comamonas koreensis]MCD2166140.1 PepSY domain-containing protein [Comamonas koreensis]